MAQQQAPGVRWRRLVTYLMVLLVIPASLVLLSQVLTTRQHYLFSMILIVYAMIPFFLVFEHRRPRARELVILAVLCALTVASRVAFLWMPSVKPMLAIVMITGMVFGGESGFLVGALSAFVANFYFGQGPWTPWQMFAYGMAGFVSGVLQSRGWMPKKPLWQGVVGFVLIVALVGPLLDCNTLFTTAVTLNWKNVAIILTNGLVFANWQHGLAVAVTMVLISEPLQYMLQRVKTKYGML